MIKLKYRNSAIDVMNDTNKTFNDFIQMPPFYSVRFSGLFHEYKNNTYTNVLKFEKNANDNMNI